MAALVSNQNEITLVSEETAVDEVIQSDERLQEIAAKLESDLNIEADSDLNIASLDDNSLFDSDTASNSSRPLENDENADANSDHGSQVKPDSRKAEDVTRIPDDTSSLKSTASKPDEHLKPEVKSSKKKKIKEKSPAASDTDSLNSKKSSSPSRNRNPLKLLKRLTKFDKSSKKSSFKSEFSTVTVDKLPQVFVAKYLGHQEVSGVSGLHNVRKPVDEMVQQVKAKFDAKEEVKLPLLYVAVSAKGLDLREHQSNKIKGIAPLGVIPIDFISYGVQDIKYWRVFTCIVVRSLSWQTRSATCHAFLCDSAHSGRKMALALGAAFSLYAKKLKSDGKSHNFQVELRPPDELVDDLAECEA